MIPVWHEYFGPVGLNLSIIILGLFVLFLAVAKKYMKKETRLFEVSLLLFLVGFLYFTLHGRLLQLPFPISVPEQPLVDNNLTFNYALTSLLTFIVFPVLLLFLLKSDFSLRSFGLEIVGSRWTVLYASLGLIFVVSLFLISQTLFGFTWIPEYTFDGLVLWILFVSVLSVFAQAFFFNGILFNRYLDYENGFLLAVISILALQMFISSSLNWAILNIVGSIAKVAVTWKTRNIYGAALMSIITNLIDIFLQVR